MFIKTSIPDFHVSILHRNTNHLVFVPATMTIIAMLGPNENYFIWNKS